MAEYESELTELSCAVILNDTERVRELTRNGHTVTWEQSPFDGTALHTAAENGNADVIPMLLDAGGAAFVNSIADGRTPLGIAVRKGHVRAVEVLLSRGAAVDARDEENAGNPPLSDAVERGFEEIVHALLSAGANPNVPGWLNLTPLDRAQHRYAKTPDDVSRRILDSVSKAAEPR